MSLVDNKHNSKFKRVLIVTVSELDFTNFGRRANLQSLFFATGNFALT